MADACWFTPDALYHYRCDNEGSSVKASDKTLCVVDEWANIERYMDRYPEEKRASYRLRNHAKLINYMWNLNRLKGEQKEIFRKVFSKEYDEALRKKGLKRDCFTNKKWFELLAIIYNNRLSFRILFFS